MTPNPLNTTLRQFKNNQSGNAFLIVFLGIVLFATLAFTISRSMRSDTTSNLSKREIALAAADILSYAQKTERAVQRLRRKNVSENDISFANDFTTGYEHTPNQPDEHKIFSPTGGNLKYTDPSMWLDESKQAFSQNSARWGEWMFSGSNTVPNLATPNRHELMLVLHFVNTDICIEINERLGITNPGGSPPPERTSSPPGGLSTGPFTGSYPSGAQGIDNGVGAEETACLTGETGGSGDYSLFYHTLIAR